MSVKMITMLSLFVDFENAIKPFVNKVYSDALGNIIAHRTGEGKRIMLVAHHDVVRLMITHIDDSGYFVLKTLCYRTVFPLLIYTRFISLCKKAESKFIDVFISVFVQTSCGVCI